ncbi:enoyl-CoA hydratase-related protein [Kribbia dieselivorans]|uniref:enoyl-CoA hydratase-related protein n=1 Tax=Kribbia dieselivorans TaxID=331526 RepID=UPI000837C9DB|nr:enoyl-CoA hydratase-related protein [Kribbia dieselivorans]
MDVTYEARDHIAVVTLNRPEARNAWTDAMEQGVIDAFERSDADDDVRVVVLTGAGSTFCAGMDLSGAGDETPIAAWRHSSTTPAGASFDVPGEELPLRRDGGGRAVLRIFESRKPVIAAMNGHAVGVGATLSLPCDIRILSNQARVAFPFTQRGFVPESCSSWFLPRLVPMQRAMEWVLTGRTLTAAEVADAGLVLRLEEPDQVLPAAMALAESIAAASAVSTSVSRRLLWGMLTADHPMEAHRLETLMLNACGVSADAIDGVQAFFEKRAPVFTETLDSVDTSVLDAPLRREYTPPAGATPLN